MVAVPRLDRLGIDGADRQHPERRLELLDRLPRPDLAETAADLAGRAGGMHQREPDEACGSVPSASSNSAASAFAPSRSAGRTAASRMCETYARR